MSAEASWHNTWTLGLSDALQPTGVMSQAEPMKTGDAVDLTKLDKAQAAPETPYIWPAEDE